MSAMTILKNAAITTVTVLAAVYVMRQLPVASDLVDKALKG